MGPIILNIGKRKSMNSYTFGLVQKIAQDTRYWAEQRAQKNSAPSCGEGLAGWCAIAAAELHKRLTAEGIESAIHVQDDSECHCYCVVEDHVVDVTATQFREYREKDVLIIHVKEAETNDYHAGQKVFNSAADLRRYQKRAGWPPSQTAYA